MSLQLVDTDPPTSFSADCDLFFALLRPRAAQQFRSKGKDPFVKVAAPEVWNNLVYFFVRSLSQWPMVS